MLQIITEKEILNSLISTAVQDAVSKILENLPSQSAPEPDERLTRQQAAKYLNCTLPTLDRYREQGRIPYYQTGRTIFFKRSEIDKALEIRAKKKGATK